MNSIFRNPQTPFLTATFNEIFFEGVTVNCSVSDFAGKAVCTQLKTEGAKDFVFVEENIFKFSLLGTVSPVVILSTYNFEILLFPLHIEKWYSIE